jgi:hypothetical protein
VLEYNNWLHDSRVVCGGQLTVLTGQINFKETVIGVVEHVREFKTRIVVQLRVYQDYASELRQSIGMAECMHVPALCVNKGLICACSGCAHLLICVMPHADFMYRCMLGPCPTNTCLAPA